MIVSNIGVDAGFLRHLHHQLRHAHRLRAGEPEGRSQDRQLRIHGAREAEDRRARLPELTAYFQSGGLVDAVLNMGLPAPIDVQVAGTNMDKSYATALKLCVADPQDSAASPTSSFRRTSTIPRCSSTSTACAPARLGLDQREVVDNVITALTSNQMIAPSFWIDPEDRQRLHADRAVSRSGRCKTLERPAGHSAARARRARSPPGST